jgi:TonB family protein
MRRDEDIRGWLGSLLFHVLIAGMLFLWQVNVTTGEPEYIEVSWGTVTPAVSSSPARPVLPGSDAGSASPSFSTPRTMDLPERKFPPADDDILRVPAGRKMDVESVPSRSRERIAGSGLAQKDRGVGSGVGSKDRFTTPGRGAYAAAVAEPRFEALPGDGAGSGISMSMTWSDGGSRKKISGDLPEYPAGVNVETQIRIETVVLPDGNVRSLKPAQKGNTKLEDAAMKAVRVWRFEPLRRSSPQREQVCTIVFNFRLK